MECHKRVKLDPAAATDYWWLGDATPETVGGNMLTVPLKSFARKFIHDLLAEERAYDDGAATFRPLVRVLFLRGIRCRSWIVDSRRIIKFAKFVFY